MSGAKLYWRVRNWLARNGWIAYPKRKPDPCDMAMLYVDGELISDENRCVFSVDRNRLHVRAWLTWAQDSEDCVPIIKKSASRVPVTMRVLMAGCGEDWIADGAIGRAEVTSSGEKAELFFEFDGKVQP